MVRNRDLQPNDRISTDDLVLLALAANNNDDTRWWQSIAILRDRGGVREFQIAADLCSSPDPRRRELGADILGELGRQERTFLSESVAMLTELLNDPDDTVLYSAIVALGNRQDPIAIPSLCKLASHSDAAIRLGIIIALGKFDTPEAIDTEIQLSTDIDRDVRNWATFALGSLLEVDSREIRAALFARAGEDDGEIRGEALLGLALRRDERALGLVRQELAGEFVGGWVVEASALLADASLVAPLLALRNRWGTENEAGFGKIMDDAIAACESKLKPSS